MGSITPETAPAARRNLRGRPAIYAYDAIYELTGVTQGSTTTESYTYDPVGNRLSSLGVSPYTVNTSNELTSTPSTTYTYDYNGNTLTKVVGSNTITYAWDYENRMTSVTLPGGGGTVTFAYDPFGRRIKKVTSTTTSIFAYDGDNLIEETNSSGAVVARYEDTQNIDEPLAMLRSGATSYYHADGLGSVTSLSSAAGSIANTYTYDSFGNLTASTGSVVNPFRYTARESDTETGLYYYRARYYDPAIGRFLAEDPSGFKGGVNHYSYTDNMPLNFIDPFGLCPCAPSGNAPDPGFYAGLGESAGWFHNDVNLFGFHRGGVLDAQADGGSTAYANYVFGVYMNAAGYSLSQTLAAANAYAYLFAHYPAKKPKDPNYPSIPAVNVTNITAGFNANKNGILCTISQ